MLEYFWWVCICITNICSKKYNTNTCSYYFSLEGVIATIAAWILLSQVLNMNNIIGCLFILIGVLISQIIPELKVNKIKQNQR